MYGNPRHPVITPPEGMVFHNAFNRKDVAPKKVVIRIREDKAKLILILDKKHTIFAVFLFPLDRDAF